MDGAVASRPETISGTAASPTRAALRRLALPVLGMIAAAALVFVATRPDEPALPGGDNRTVVDEWYASIASLGIRAIYPPTEDMHVGDLWAVLIPPGGEEDELAPSLLSRSVRVGHIDLREHLTVSARRRPLFADAAQTEEARRENERLRLEVGGPDPTQPISLSLVSFPTSRVKRTVQVSAEGGTWLGAFAGTRSLNLVDEISVPHALGYGVPVTDATHALLAWCNEVRLRCSTNYIEGLMRYALGARALEAEKPDGPRPQVALRLVNYVFLARQIEQRRVLEGTVGTDGTLGAARPAEPPAGSPGGPRVAADGATIQVSSADSRGVSVSQTFARPIVIGYRAVTVVPFPGNGGP